MENVRSGRSAQAPHDIGPSRRTTMPSMGGRRTTPSHEAPCARSRPPATIRTGGRWSGRQNARSASEGMGSWRKAAARPRDRWTETPADGGRTAIRPRQKSSGMATRRAGGSSGAGDRGAKIGAGNPASPRTEGPEVPAPASCRLPGRADGERVSRRLRHHRVHPRKKTASPPSRPNGPLRPAGPRPSPAPASARALPRGRRWKHAKKMRSRSCQEPTARVSSPP
jgi:hypothetical protein